MASSIAVRLGSALLAWSVLSFAPGLFAAEKLSVTVSNQYGPVQQRLAIPISDVSGHEIGTQTRQGTSSSSNAEWDGASLLPIGQFDLVKGSGMISGFNTRTFKNGDKLFSKFKHMLQRISDAESKFAISEGRSEIVGGTGKFANAKGTSSYAGQIGAAGGLMTETFEIEY